jgi:hypothetical protein
MLERKYLPCKCLPPSAASYKDMDAKIRPIEFPFIKILHFYAKKQEAARPPAGFQYFLS